MNSTQIIRTVRREKMNKKMIIYKDLMETSEATRFNLLSHEDYSFRHANCLHLRNTITDENMKLIWRKKSLEVIPTEVKKIKIAFRKISITDFMFNIIKNKSERLIQ